MDRERACYIQPHPQKWDEKVPPTVFPGGKDTVITVTQLPPPAKIITAISSETNPETAKTLHEVGKPAIIIYETLRVNRISETDLKMVVRAELDSMRRIMYSPEFTRIGKRPSLSDEKVDRYFNSYLRIVNKLFNKQHRIIERESLDGTIYLSLRHPLLEQLENLPLSRLEAQLQERLAEAYRHITLIPGSELDREIFSLNRLLRNRTITRLRRKNETRGVTIASTPDVRTSTLAYSLKPFTQRTVI